MNGSDSVFFDLPPLSAAACFYVALLLAVALFFKFNRLLSMRNWDVPTLFAAMPGLLLLLESHGRAWWGYFWLLCGSGYFLVRCLLDLILVRRPALGPNLSFGGLLWLAGALFVSLVAVPVRQPGAPPANGANPVTPLEAGRQGVEPRLKDWAPPQVPEPLFARWVERALTLLCHLSIVAGLVLIGRRHFDDVQAGAAAALFYLLLPYAYLLMPSAVAGLGRWDYPWPMAWMVWSVLAYRRPILAGVFLGVAAGSVFFPLLAVPVWLSFYRGRGAARFAGGVVLGAAAALAVIGAVLWLNGQWPNPLPPLWTQTSWQPWRESPADMPGFWQGLHWAYRIPVFILSLAFVAGTLFWPSPKDLAHVLALSAANLISIQFWYPDQGGVYVLWYLPFLLLLVFRPNLTACRPPPPAPDDWLARGRRALLRRARRLLRLREPARVG